MLPTQSCERALGATLCIEGIVTASPWLLIPVQLVKGEFVLSILDSTRWAWRTLLSAGCFDQIVLQNLLSKTDVEGIALEGKGFAMALLVAFLVS